MTLQEIRLLGPSDKANPKVRPETVRFRGPYFENRRRLLTSGSHQSMSHKASLSF